MQIPMGKFTLDSKGLALSMGYLIEATNHAHPAVCSAEVDDILFQRRPEQLIRPH